MNPRQALGLPPGSVRAMLAFLLVGSTCYAAIAGNFEAASTLAPLAVMVLRDYFTKGERPG